MTEEEANKLAKFLKKKKINATPVEQGVRVDFTVVEMSYTFSDKKHGWECAYKC